MCEKAGPVVRPFVFLESISHQLRLFQQSFAPHCLDNHSQTALDALHLKLTLILMKLLRTLPSTPLAGSHRPPPLSFIVTPFICSFVLLGLLRLRAAEVSEASMPVLEFIQPTNGAVFSTLDEIPIVLRAFAPNDVFSSADVSANQQHIATVQYCCAFCPCARPIEGQETILQIAVPWDGGMPPSRIWQGWTNVQAGSHRLTARATGENGTELEAAPITIAVVDRTLHIFVTSDGAATLVIPQGSLVPGGYDLEASQDLLAWTRLGPFQPGNVAAFYYDLPPATAPQQRFYRSVYVPPPDPLSRDLRD